jgi:hypothetical protein
MPVFTVADRTVLGVSRATGVALRFRLIWMHFGESGECELAPFANCLTSTLSKRVAESGESLLDIGCSTV